jgi:hypothetical protein
VADWRVPGVGGREKGGWLVGLAGSQVGLPVGLRGAAQGGVRLRVKGLRGL